MPNFIVSQTVIISPHEPREADYNDEAREAILQQLLSENPTKQVVFLSNDPNYIYVLPAAAALISHLTVVSDANP